LVDLFELHFASVYYTKRHWTFSLTLAFQPRCGPGIDWAYNRKKYQELFPGSKGGRCLGLTT